jgi:hypothetical protein
VTIPDDADDQNHGQDQRGVLAVGDLDGELPF